jgi:hypothetical protein
LGILRKYLLDVDIGALPGCGVFQRCRRRRSVRPSVPVAAPGLPSFVTIAAWTGLQATVQEAIQVTPVRFGAAAAWENRLGNASSPCPAPGRSRRCAVETASDCSRRTDRRPRSGGAASTLHSCRVELAVFRGQHAFGTSVRLWGCAGRSYPSHSTSRSPAMWREARGQVAPIQLEARAGRVLVWACCVRRNALAKSGILRMRANSLSVRPEELARDF